MWRFLSWLANWSWERSYGIDVDQDGNVDGSGIMLRLESPFAHRLFMYRWIGKLTPEWMKVQRREDISDVLLSSLLTQPMFPPVTMGDFHGTVTWAEDQLDSGKDAYTNSEETK